jgi:hypothetical protein
VRTLTPDIAATCLTVYAMTALPTNEPNFAHHEGSRNVRVKKKMID